MNSSSEPRPSQGHPAEASNSQSVPSVLKSAGAQRTLKYGGSEMKAFKRASLHCHSYDGGDTEVWGDGRCVLHVRHPSRRSPEPLAQIYEPGGLNQWGESFVYADYFLPEELAGVPQ